jgi:ABC-type uncharacterized transport system ATPase subunit
MTAISLRGIVKRFGAVTACDGVDLDVRGGEIVALVGENGAGKSTLMHILHGEIAPDAGSITVAGQAVRFGSPADAIAAGLGMVHQHFMLFPSLTVAENVVFAAEPRRRGFFDRTAAHAVVHELAGRYGLAVDPGARVAALPVGVRQRVEILKLLYRRAQVLILDEPTAVLAPAERAGLFAVLGRLRAEGKGIVFITHKLDEVLAVSDRAVVLRAGRVVAEARTSETTAEALAAAMVGRAPEALPGAPPGQPPGALAGGLPGALPGALPDGRPGEVLLEAVDLHVDGRGSEAVRGVSLTVRAREIVGIAGVAGNGQSLLVQALVGLGRAAVRSGAVRICGVDVTTAPVAARRAAGLAYVPEDRQRTGLALGASVADNLVMGHHRRHSRRGLLGRRALRALARALVEAFGVQGDRLDREAATLSGGNQQKLVLARELAHEAAVLVAEQPTRGVDLGAARAVHEALLGYRDAGYGVLLVSADLGELLALADRILVMYEGRILGELDRAQADEAVLGQLMAGQGAAA